MYRLHALTLLWKKYYLMDVNVNDVQYANAPLALQVVLGIVLSDTGSGSWLLEVFDLGVNYLPS